MRRPRPTALSMQKEHKIYRVLPDLEAGEDHELRVIDESGEDYLFLRDWFMLVELPKTLKESLLRTSRKVSDA